jgi:hypothetical protein
MTSQPSDSPTDELTVEEKAQVVSWVKKQYQKCKDQRSKQEQQWYLNLAFYFGRQNVQLIRAPGQSTKLTVPKAPYWRTRAVSNRIRPIIRKELSKVVSSKPTAYVVPASSEDKDMFAAQAAESLWYSFYDEKKLESVIYSAEFWTLICGTGFLKCYWDGTIGDPNSPETIGDVVVERETPFNIFIPDTTEESLEKQPYVIHASMRNLEWAQLRYGQMVENPIQATGRGESIMDTGFLKLIGADDQPLDSVEVVEAWVKPGQFKKMPFGAVITLVGDQLAQYIKGWPFEHGKYPFVKLNHVPTGSFYGESIITDLLPLQKEYNRTRSQIIEAKNKMAKPQLMAPKGSINPASITTEPGQIILYRPGFQPPEPLPLQSLPSYVLQELDRIRVDMDDIAGQHDVSRGTVPPGVTAATAISYLQEQDDTMLSYTVRSLEQGVQDIAQLFLNYVKQYWTAPRMVKTTGVDGSFDVISFMSSDLRNNTDIRIERDSALPTSRAAKQAFLMDLMKMGFIDPNYGLELMEVGGLNKLYEKMNQDKRQAQRENIRMQQIDEPNLMGFAQAQQIFDQAVQQGAMVGTGPIKPDGTPMQPPPAPVPVNSWDNHLMHIDTHNNFRKTQTFEALPDEVKTVFEAHVSMHRQALAGLQQAAMMEGQGPPQDMQQQESNAQPGPEPMPNLESEPQTQSPGMEASA